MNREIHWLEHCLPVFVHPKHDIEDNGLLAIFVEFIGSNCHLKLVFASEASYNCRNPKERNMFGSLIYRTHNLMQYKRTADIKYLTFHGVNLDYDAALNGSNSPWFSISSSDFSGEQNFSNGVLFQFCLVYSCFEHYTDEIPKSQWRMHSKYRPLVYLNTCNHMFSNLDLNLDMEKHYWNVYPVLSGNSDAAQRFGQLFVPNKVNCCSPFIGCFSCCMNCANSVAQGDSTSLQSTHEESHEEIMEQLGLDHEPCFNCNCFNPNYTLTAGNPSSIISNKISAAPLSSKPNSFLYYPVFSIAELQLRDAHPVLRCWMAGYLQSIHTKRVSN